MEVKSRTANGITYTAKAVEMSKTGTLAGDLAIKYQVYGASMTTKLFTAGQITNEAVIDQLGVKGLKLTVLAGLAPNTQTGSATLEYLHPNIATTAMVSTGGPGLYGSMAFGLEGLTVGAEAQYDADSQVLKTVNGAINYVDGKESEATLTMLNMGKVAKFAYSHDISRDFSVAAEFAYDTESDNKLMTMGTKYNLDPITMLKTKIDSAGSLAVSYIQALRPNTTLVLCTKFDVRGMEKGTNKIGMSLCID